MTTQDQRITTVLTLLRKFAEDYREQHLSKCLARPASFPIPISRHCTCSWKQTLKEAEGLEMAGEPLGAALRIYIYVQQYKSMVHVDPSCYKRCTCAESTVARLLAIAGHLRALGLIQRESGITYVNRDGERVLRLAWEACAVHQRAEKTRKVEDDQATQDQDSAS